MKQITLIGLSLFTLINLTGCSTKTTWFSNEKEKISYEYISESNYFITNPKENKNAWNKIFGNDNPIELEIGMGKGDFIIKKALLNPNINYIGFEKFDSVLFYAIKKTYNNS